MLVKNRAALPFCLVIFFICNSTAIVYSSEINQHSTGDNSPAVNAGRDVTINNYTMSQEKKDKDKLNAAIINERCSLLKREIMNKEFILIRNKDIINTLRVESNILSENLKEKTKECNEKTKEYNNYLKINKKHLQENGENGNYFRNSADYLFNIIDILREECDSIENKLERKTDELNKKIIERDENIRYYKHYLSIFNVECR